MFPGEECFRSRLFSGFADERNEGDQLFSLCPRPFRRSAFPAIKSISLGIDKLKGNVLRGRAVLNMILLGKPSDCLKTFLFLDNYVHYFSEMVFVLLGTLSIFML